MPQPIARTDLIEIVRQLEIASHLATHLELPVLQHLIAVALLEAQDKACDIGTPRRLDA